MSIPLVGGSAACADRRPLETGGRRLVVLIGQPSPDDIYELASDLLVRNAELRAEAREARKDRNYYRSRLAAELKRKATS